MAKRCINLDWFELFCLETKNFCSADYFRQSGFQVLEREYGTRVYAEMFTLGGTDGYPLLEIRRRPLSDILPPTACHVRLTNRTCYYETAVPQLLQLLEAHGIAVQRVSRADICLDFTKFDSGDQPQTFIRRYMNGKFAKINQSKIRAFGQDNYDKRNWNSLSWGAPSSPIGTKLYNKTLELEEVKDKPYIRQAWLQAGLIDDPFTLNRIYADGQVEKQNVWRLEFSIKSEVKNWTTIALDGDEKRKYSLPNRPDMYSTKAGLLALFASLCQHYFHFKYYQPGINKYKSPDKVLFKFDTMTEFYSVEHLATPNDKDKAMSTLLLRLKQFRDTHTDFNLRDAANTIITYLEEQDKNRMSAQDFSFADIKALQLAINAKLAGSAEDVQELIRSFKTDIETTAEAIF